MMAIPTGIVLVCVASSSACSRPGQSNATPHKKLDGSDAKVFKANCKDMHIGSRGA